MNGSRGGPGGRFELALVARDLTIHRAAITTALDTSKGIIAVDRGNCITVRRWFLWGGHELLYDYWRYSKVGYPE